MRTVLLLFLVFLVSGCSLYTEVQNFTNDVSDEDRIEFAQSLASKGAYAPSIEILEGLSKKSPQDESVLLALADVYFDATDYRKSGEIYQRLIATGERGCVVFNGAGNVARQMSQPAQASIYFSECLMDDGENVTALMGAAISADLNQEYENARDYYLHLIRIDPNNLAYRNNYAVSLILSGHVKAAVTEISNWVNYPQSKPKYRQNLALAYALIGEWEKSKMLTLIDLPPHQARQNLGYYKFLYHSKDKGALRSALLGAS